MTFNMKELEVLKLLLSMVFAFASHHIFGRQMNFKLDFSPIILFTTFINPSAAEV